MPTKHRHRKPSSFSALTAVSTIAAAARALRSYKSGRSRDSTKKPVKKPNKKPPRKPFSLTWTVKNKKKESKDHVEAIHGEIVRKKEYFVIGRKKPIKNPSGGNWKILDQGSSSMGSLEGLQGVSTLFEVANYSQLAVSSGTAYTTQTQAYVNLFDANPYQYTTGGLLNNFSLVAVNDDRVVLKNVVCKLEMANFSNVPLTMDLYWIKTKKNVTTTYYPEVVWNDVLTTQALGKPVAVPRVGAGITAGYENYKIIGTKPESCPAFNKLFKILKKSKYELAPGSNLCFDITLIYNKLVDKQFLAEQSSATLIGGYTFIPMVVMRGSVGKDNTTGSTTIAPTELGYVYTREYTVFSPSPNRLQQKFVYPNLESGNATGVSLINVVDASNNAIKL